MNIRGILRGIAVFGAAGVLAFAGCDKDKNKNQQGGGGGGGGGPKIAFVTNNASDFWKIAHQGVKKYENEAKIKVDMKMPPTGTVQEQNQILEDLVSQGYQGIAVSVIAPDDQVTELNKAAAKTKLITHDSDAPKSNRILYIGTNNYEAGRMLGKEIVGLLNQNDKIAVFVGTFSADNAKERLRGIEDVIKEKNITIAARKEDNKDPAKAASNPEDVLVAQPDVKMLVGLWSYNGPAISDAIERSGKKGKVLAAVFDEEDGTLAGIEKGVVSCTVVQKPFQFGYLSAKTLHEMIKDGKTPGEKSIDTGVEVVKAANVAAFRKTLADMKK